MMTENKYQSDEFSSTIKYQFYYLCFDPFINSMETNFIEITPVLPSQNIDRDVQWYHDQAGFDLVFKDDMYAGLKRENINIHLQWHADTIDDPLLGGSVIRIFVKNIENLFNEFVMRKTVQPESLRMNTPWKTNEFGFYDLNNNAVFIVEDH